MAGGDLFALVIHFGVRLERFKFRVSCVILPLKIVIELFIFDVYWLIVVVLASIIVVDLILLFNLLERENAAQVYRVLVHHQLLLLFIEALRLLFLGHAEPVG